MTTEPVLLGAAMLGAVAAGVHRSIPEAMTLMSGVGRSTEPTPPHMAKFHAAKRRGYPPMGQLHPQRPSTNADGPAPPPGPRQGGASPPPPPPPARPSST